MARGAVRAKVLKPFHLISFPGLHHMAKAKGGAKGQAKAKGREGPQSCPSPPPLPPMPEVSDTLVAGVPSAVVPPLLHPQLPPPERIQKARENWFKLGDAYINRVVTEGLKLEWIEGFNPEDLDVSFPPLGISL